MKADCRDDHDIIYKDVVIVGNGPAAISLSYMLAGYWPYYTGDPHPGDDMLTARLHFVTRANPSKDEPDDDDDDDEESASDVDADAKDPGGVNGKAKRKRKSVARHGRGLARSSRCTLQCLSSGLEGRSGGRPLSLLMDQLQHPCVDAGLDLPGLLAWKSPRYHPEHKIVDHVVLGKGSPGGAWNSMAPNVLTISLSRWMSLPGLDLRQWEMLRKAEKYDVKHQVDNHAQQRINSCKTANRIPVGTVAAYYKDYVERQGLSKYFRCKTTVTSVKPVPGVRNSYKEYGWMVEGYSNETDKPFRYRCRRVVLATGTTDLSNRLGVPGEKTESWVTHDLNDVEERLERLSNLHMNNNVIDDSKSPKRPVDPLLVVGAGLSAADAVMAARFHGVPVLHVSRDSSGDWKSNSDDTDVKLTATMTNGSGRLQWLPASMYPEYHKIYEMMADGGTNYPLYKALPRYTLVRLASDPRTMEQQATLCSPDGRLTTYRVSIAAILIGSKPDLSYLDNNGLGLGKYVDNPIDNRSNSIEVDDFTYEVIRAPRKGMYALGPLVGDNFVRFIVGGAFAIVNHILLTT